MKRKIISIVLVFSISLSFTVLLSGCKKNKKDEEEITTQYQDTYNPNYYNPDDSGIQQDMTEEYFSSTQATETTVSAQTTVASQPTVTQAQNSSASYVTGTEISEDGNKTIVYPKALEAGNGCYPVIVWANGTGCATSTYMSLLNMFAQAGYIVVADSSVMTADGTSQRESVDYIISQAGNSSSKFYNKVDTYNIGASGHSQGGRSCVNAAQVDKRIKCIVSIAGASSAQEADGLTTPTLFLTGTSDMIVVSSQWVKPSYDATAGRAVYASLKNAAHTTCMTNPEKVSGYCISWFDAYLKGDGNAMNVFSPDGQLANDSAWQDFATKN